MRRKRRRGVRRNGEQWSEILRRCEASGLTSRAFCDGEGLPLSSFQRWQRKLRSGPLAKFVEVLPPAIMSGAATTWSLEISLPNGASLRFQG
jgi:hypothetical protein